MAKRRAAPKRRSEKSYELSSSRREEEIGTQSRSASEGSLQPRSSGTRT